MDNMTEFLAHHGIKGQTDTLVSNLEFDGAFLEHYQIKGAKHGVRRFQNPDGSLTPEGRERYGVGPARGSSESASGGKTKNKKPKFTLKVNGKVHTIQSMIDKASKAKQTFKTAEEKLEETKDYLVKHPKKLPKYGHTLSEKDAQDVVKRIEFDRKLKDVRRQEYRRGWEVVNDITRNVGTLATLTRNSKDLWNNTAEIYNGILDITEATGKTDKPRKRMPTIGKGDNNQGNKDKNKDNQN